MCGNSLGLIEDRNAVQRVKVLPGHALRIGNPVLFAAGIAACGFAFIEHRHISSLRTLLEFHQLGCLIDLEAQVIKSSGLAATCRDGEIYPWVIQHPLCVISGI